MFYKYLGKEYVFIATKCTNIIRQGPKLFPRLHSKKVVPAGQLSMPKLGLKMPNQHKPEITNYKHQMTNKFQISFSKYQIRSKANCLGFWI